MILPKSFEVPVEVAPVSVDYLVDSWNIDWSNVNWKSAKDLKNYILVFHPREYYVREFQKLDDLVDKIVDEKLNALLSKLKENDIQLSNAILKDSWGLVQPSTE